MRKIQLVSLLALVVVSLSNCKKDTEVGPTGPAGAPGPSYVGNIKGFVSNWDQFGGRILSNQAGDTVRVDGTNIRAVTDSTGLYSLNGLSTGMYNITVTRPGFGLNRVQNIQFVGGGDTYRDVRLSQPSTSNITALADSGGTYMSNPNVTVYGTIATDPHARSFLLYIGDNPGVSPNPLTYLIFNTKNVNANSVKVAFVIPLSDLSDAGFVAGQSIYYAAFGINSGFANASSFEDFTTGRTVFTALSNTPATTSMIMP